METLQAIFSAKVIIVGLVMLVASILDIRTRRIHDEAWMLMAAVCIPLVGWEMWIKGGSEDPLTLLTLLLPIGGLLFILFGYPEPKQAIKGSPVDILFTIIYLVCILGPVIGYMHGNMELFVPVAVSFVFMIIYFILYQVPIGGARIIHGGADAKCLMALAAIFPWYVDDLFYAIGPFMDFIEEFPSFGYLFPIHLSVLFNGAVITAILLLIALPVYNISKGDISIPRMFTWFRMDVDGIEGKHVWVILEHTRKKKVEPTARIERRLKKMGLDRVWVSPKIPFIMSLFIGFLVQISIGNIVFLLFLIFGLR